MRYPKPRRHQQRHKTVIFTGGLNDVVTNIELKEGELHKVLNYQEIDSPYHGYASVAGYEVYDGKTAPSNVGVQAVSDEGDDGDCVFLAEGPTETNDISSVGNPTTNFGVITSTLVTKYDGGCLDFADTYFTITPVLGFSFDPAFSSAFDASTQESGAFSFQGNWTLDVLIRPKVRPFTEVLMEKPGVLKLSISEQGFLTLGISTTASATYDLSLVQLSRDFSNSLFAHLSIVNMDDTIRWAVDGIPLEDGASDIQELSHPGLYNSTAKVWVGTDYQYTEMYHGYLDEIRYSGIARWYHAFDPPTMRYSDPGFSEINWIDVEREAQRALITEVPGSGPCTGVHLYKGEVYALRNTLDGQAAALYVAHSEPDGNGGIDDDLSGWVLIDNTFNPNGRMDCENWRFSGSFADQQVMCIVDGASLPRIYNKADDTVYLFDNAEAAGIPDRQVEPRYSKILSVFDNRLVLGYELDDILLSSKTDPRDFSGGFGDQLLIGDDITNFQEMPGESLGIFCRNSIKTLTKLQLPTSDSASPDFTFKVENFSRESGAFPWTAERVLSKILYADDRGIVDFQSTDKYGDFVADAISKKVNRIYLANKLKISTSLVNKNTNQYRLFFTDGSSLWFTFLEEDLKGATYIVYPDPVLIADEGEDTEGTLVKFFTSNDGFIYQMDKGTSYNGAEIETLLNSSYYPYASPRYWKQFHRTIFEMSASRGTEFNIRMQFDYDTSRMPDTLWWEPLLTGVSGIWGTDAWGSFVWGGSVTQELVHYIRGHGRNMSMELLTRSKFNDVHIVHNAIVDYTQEYIQE